MRKLRKILNILLPAAVIIVTASVSIGCETQSTNVPKTETKETKKETNKETKVTEKTEIKTVKKDNSESTKKETKNPIDEGNKSKKIEEKPETNGSGYITLDEDLKPKFRPNTLPPKLSEDKYVYDATDNYYASLNGLSGKELRDQLIKIQGQNTKNHKPNYQSLPNFYELHFRDKYYDKDNSIIDVFGEVNGADPYKYQDYTRGVSSTGAEGEGLNREHVIPQSWFRKNKRARSDAHFVWPSDVYVNFERGNMYHDYVATDTKETFQSGAKIGKNVLSVEVFEPQDFFKGDIARAYLYFTFTYPSILNSRNGNSFYNTEEPYIPKHYLRTYIKWHNLDTVDEFNIDLNNAISKYNKGIRNPFIDYPNLVENLFGDNPKPFVNKGVLASVKK